jgi:hypothetical protein
MTVALDIDQEVLAMGCEWFMLDPRCHRERASLVTGGGMVLLYKDAG